MSKRSTKQDDDWDREEEEMRFKMALIDKQEAVRESVLRSLLMTIDSSVKAASTPGYGAERALDMIEKMAKHAILQLKVADEARVVFKANRSSTRNDR